MHVIRKFYCLISTLSDGRATVFAMVAAGVALGSRDSASDAAAPEWGKTIVARGIGHEFSGHPRAHRVDQQSLMLGACISRAP